MHCIVLLVMFHCTPAQAILSSATAGATFYDTYRTQKSYDLCRVMAGCNLGGIEKNPLYRPFQANGRPLAYVSTTFLNVGVESLSDAMHGSRNKWARRFWWAPKVAEIGAAFYGGFTQRRDYNRALELCGRGCAEALR